MTYRKAEVSDINNIMSVIDSAKKHLKSQGVDQWQDGFPNPDVIRNDIKNNLTYVFTEENVIIAYVTLGIAVEASYKNIYEGNWLLDTAKYATIHRTAIDGSFRGHGISSDLFELCDRLARKHGMESVRVDTHHDNAAMQHIVRSQGFTYCGRILLERDGTSRDAFEKLL